MTNKEVVEYILSNSFCINLSKKSLEGKLTRSVINAINTICSINSFKTPLQDSIYNHKNIILFRQRLKSTQWSSYSDAINEFPAGKIVVKKFRENNWQSEFQFVFDIDDIYFLIDIYNNEDDLIDLSGVVNLMKRSYLYKKNTDYTEEFIKLLTNGRN